MTLRRFRLPINLQLFAADTGSLEGGETGSGDPGTPSPTPDPTKEPGQNPGDIMIPKTRFDEINNQYKTAKEQLDQFLATQKQAEEDAAKQRGEYEQLYNTAQQEAGTFKEQAEQTSARVLQLEGVITGMLETKLADVPESMRELIPENLTPEQKLAWIDKAAAAGVFGTPKQPDEPIGSPTNPGSIPPVNLDNLDPFTLLKAGYGGK